uniref:ATP synthase protein I n=1 Tax=Amphora coffeiformis TaxID=265554 RepID=A0A7S3P9V9_9STRA|mmetsp:Transcript_9698/g.18744  ORF Transcript_9698/g.18744 Transcript_9698/m.18744 type:complete len:228 (+) Transcript_9698:82-765(+)|eukprot:scaffold1551_cov166-Amphora_coffeaeformis.AAC.11
MQYSTLQSVCMLSLLLSGSEGFSVYRGQKSVRDGAISPHSFLSLPTTNICGHSRCGLTMSATDEDEMLGLRKIKVGDKEFWMRQKELIQEMQNSSEASAKAEAREKFAKRRLALVGDTAYIGFMIFCACWIFSPNPFVAISYALGATLGSAYSYGLGRYVENVGASIDDEGAAQGAGVGEARFAFLIVLFIFVGKFKSAGLLEIPSIAGFFTYQLASLRQGLKEYND